MQKLVAWSALIATGLAGTASAEDVLIDAFENAPFGTRILGQSGSFGGNPDPRVVADTDGGDQAGATSRLPGAANNLGHGGLSVEEGSTGTFFTQFRVDAAGDPNAVLAFGDGDGFNNNVYAVKFRDQGGGLTLQNSEGGGIASLDTGATYNFFAVIENGTPGNDDLDVFLQSDDDDDDFATLTEVGLADSFIISFGAVSGGDSDPDLADTVSNYAFANFGQTPVIYDINVTTTRAGTSSTPSPSRPRWRSWAWAAS